MRFESRAPCAILVVILGLGAPAGTLAGTDAPGTPLDDGILAIDLFTDRTDEALAVDVGRDGKIVVAGTARGGGSRFVVARYLPGGGLDTSFGGGAGYVIDPVFVSVQDEASRASAVKVLDDGKILVAGGVLTGSSPGWDSFVARLDTDGGADSSFGVAGTGAVVVPFDYGNDDYDEVVAMTVDSQGRIVAASEVRADDANLRMGVLRTSASGVLDTTIFGTGYLTYEISGADNVEPHAIATDAEDRIYVGGGAKLVGFYDRDLFVARLTGAGGFDTAFGPGGVFLRPFDLGGNDYDTVYGLAVRPDGKVVLVGEVDVGGDTHTWLAALLLADGTGFDPTFAGVGDGYWLGTFRCGLAVECRFHDSARAVRLQSDGKIVLAGFGSNSGEFPHLGLARLDPNGALDSDFHFSGTTFYDLLYGVGNDIDWGYALAFDGAGRIVVAGTTEWNYPDFDFAWVRFQNDHIFGDGFESGGLSGWSASTSP